jgi:hypothetical protein
MMAGCAQAILGPQCFLLGFMLSEVIAVMSEITKEDMRMVHKAAVSSGKYLWSCVKSSTNRIIAFWEAHLPSRQSLLTSLCNPSEKGQLPNNSFKPKPLRGSA